MDVEPHILEAVGSGRLRPDRGAAVAFVRAADGGGMAPGRTASGDCGFHHAKRCSLQTAGGETMLPSACRHFPRVYLRDGRGDLLTLSHFCPTAARLLLDPAPLRIVEAAPPLALAEPIEGLDARGALPPLLRPGMLADLAGYDAWEHAVTAVFFQAPDASTAFARIDAATSRIRAWSPERGPLVDAVASAFGEASSAAPDPGAEAGLTPAFALVRELTGPHPLMEVPGDFATRWRSAAAVSGADVHHVIARYLAASTFANWIAYRGLGLRTIVAWLRGCHDVLRLQMVRRLAPHAATVGPEQVLEAVRLTDYIMVHTVDSMAFGRAMAAAEAR